MFFTIRFSGVFCFKSLITWKIMYLSRGLFTVDFHAVKKTGKGFYK